MATAQLTPDQMAKLTALTMKLGTDESTALSKALDLADYIADTDADPDSKLLVEQKGQFTELQRAADSI